MQLIFNFKKYINYEIINDNAEDFLYSKTNSIGFPSSTAQVPRLDLQRSIKKRLV